MPDFRKSYKKSKNSKNSKSGGRRRKHTMRKYRRGKKSRKVMRGGKQMVTLNNVIDQLIEFTPNRGGSFQNDFQERFGKTWDDYVIEKGGADKEIDIDTLINDPLWAGWQWKISNAKLDNVKTQLEGIKSQE